MSREQAGALRPNKATRQVVVVQGSGGQLEPGQSSGQSCFDRGVLRATTWAAGGHLSGGDWTLAKGESLVSLGGGGGGGGVKDHQPLGCPGNRPGGALGPNKATRQVVVVQGSGGQLEPSQSSGQSYVDRVALDPLSTNISNTLVRPETQLLLVLLLLLLLLLLSVLLLLLLSLLLPAPVALATTTPAVATPPLLLLLLLLSLLLPLLLLSLLLPGAAATVPATAAPVATTTAVATPPLPPCAAA